MARKTKARRKAPWKRPAPGRKTHAKLSTSDKASAKKRARRAGRRYPNLVDNMRAAASKRKS